jgi:hypothetical protein
LISSDCLFTRSKYLEVLRLLVDGTLMAVMFVPCRASATTSRLADIISALADSQTLLPCSMSACISAERIAPCASDCHTSAHKERVTIRRTYQACPPYPHTGFDQLSLPPPGLPFRIWISPESMITIIASTQYNMNSKRVGTTKHEIARCEVLESAYGAEATFRIRDDDSRFGAIIAGPSTIGPQLGGKRELQMTWWWTGMRSQPGPSTSGVRLFRV